MAIANPGTSSSCRLSAASPGNARCHDSRQGEARPAATSKPARSPRNIARSCSTSRSNTSNRPSGGGCEFLRTTLFINCTACCSSSSPGSITTSIPSRSGIVDSSGQAESRNPRTRPRSLGDARCHDASQGGACPATCTTQNNSPADSNRRNSVTGRTSMPSSRTRRRGSMHTKMRRPSSG